MSVISIEIAMQHLRAEQDDSAMVQAYLDAAEDTAERFMGRRIYADEEALAVAKASTAAAISLAYETWRSALDGAGAIVDEAEQADARRRADLELSSALSKLEMIEDGVVLNPSISAACLLIAGHLFEHREDVLVGSIATRLPMGSEALLYPYRIGLGV